MLTGIALTMAGLVFGACGSNSSSTSGTQDAGGPAPVAPYSAGIDGTRTVSTLTDAEKSGLCTSGITYYSMSVSRADACRLQSVGNTSGITFSGTANDDGVQSNCSREQSSCLDASPTSRSFYTTLCVPKLSCAATVADYERCVNDLGKALVAGMVDFPRCQDLMAANYKSIESPALTLANTNQPASCQALDAKCTGLTQAVLTMLYPGGR
jgi:hypothetical protein